MIFDVFMHTYVGLVLAVAIIGFVIVGYQVVPHKLIPKRKPFTCGFCMSIWMSVLLSVALLCVTPTWFYALTCVVMFGTSAGLSAFAVTFLPEAFYDEGHSPAISDEYDSPTVRAPWPEDLQELNPYRPPRSPCPDHNE